MNDLTGQAFGLLTVIGPAEPRLSGKARRVEQMEQCRCACGTVKVVYRRNLTRGLSRSCGCETIKAARIARRSMRHAIPSYEGAHRNVREARGGADTHACECGEPAEHWAYDNADPDELVAPYKRPSGTFGYLFYSAKIDHYVAMCRPCHWAFDAMARAARRAGARI